MIGFVSDHSNLRLGMQLFSVAILISALIWAWKVLASWEVMPWPAGGMVLPKAQCHRGLHPQGVQENSLEAFRGAAKAGAEMVELDVRLSRDGQAVVIHDADISRVAGGRAGSVAELTAAELKSRASAPSLYEVLADRDCARLLVNVELKHLGDAHKNRRLAAAVQKALSDAKAERRVIFSSFNPLLLREMSKLLPDVPRALLATGAQEPGNKFYLRKMWLAFLARPHMLNLDGRYFSAKLAASLAARRVPVAVWTVETPEEARKFLAMGAKSIISPIPKVV
jgi:glycerophosphoryl diester phosphodiesterase